MHEAFYKKESTTPPWDDDGHPGNYCLMMCIFSWGHSYDEARSEERASSSRSSGQEQQPITPVYDITVNEYTMKLASSHVWIGAKDAAVTRPCR
jgi:hypothetical protein